ncbi:formyltransferase family protein [Pedobacter sp. UBA4863]|uniref:formyltransferase family protein n=1 Tax=Pedobacter sp. UBA4863 TaxID=1947060 RepID=UPI0025DFA054|nr:formyltransferase family protein [Pedobacter sp. UBA4863]
MPKIILANCNTILQPVQDEISRSYDVINVYTKAELIDAVKSNPEYVFFLHWSWIIPETIFNNYDCVVFHMTDLPYGRGGSPLQNLIINGHKETKLSALKVDKGLDTGNIYLKRDLSLSGTAAEIFSRAGTLIKEMIKEIIETKIIPLPQKGEPTIFTRRKPEESLITDNILEIEKLYDFIRMLDADNYPNAFLETKNFKFEFNKGQIVSNNKLTANVTITKK